MRDSKTVTAEYRNPLGAITFNVHTVKSRSTNFQGLDPSSNYRHAVRLHGSEPTGRYFS